MPCAPVSCPATTQSNGGIERTYATAGELEYCTLLGHVLHVDLAVCFAAMRTLAHFLKGITFTCDVYLKEGILWTHDSVMYELHLQHGTHRISRLGE